MLNKYIQNQLNDYYPGSRKVTPALVDEIVRHFTDQNMGQIEFDEALEAYRKCEKAMYCPTWIELRQHLPNAIYNNWKGRKVFGIYISIYEDFQKFSDLTSIGCTSPAILKKYKLKEPGLNLILAASILMECAVNDDERRVAGKYMEWANTEHKRIAEYRAKHLAAFGESVWLAAYRRICAKQEARQ